MERMKRRIVTRAKTQENQEKEWRTRRRAGVGSEDLERPTEGGEQYRKNLKTGHPREKA